MSSMSSRRSVRGRSVLLAVVGALTAGVVLLGVHASASAQTASAPAISVTTVPRPSASPCGPLAKNARVSVTTTTTQWKVVIDALRPVCGDVTAAVYAMPDRYPNAWPQLRVEATTFRVGAGLTIISVNRQCRPSQYDVFFGPAPAVIDLVNGPLHGPLISYAPGTSKQDWNAPCPAVVPPVVPPPTTPVMVPTTPTSTATIPGTRPRVTVPTTRPTSTTSTSTSTTVASTTTLPAVVSPAGSTPRPPRTPGSSVPAGTGMPTEGGAVPTIHPKLVLMNPSASVQPLTLVVVLLIVTVLSLGTRPVFGLTRSAAGGGEPEESDDRDDADHPYEPYGVGGQPPALDASAFPSAPPPDEVHRHDP